MGDVHKEQKGSLPVKKCIVVLFTMLSISVADGSLTDVCICHKQGNTWKFRIIPKHALPGHLRHGDFLYKGRPDVYDWEMDDWCNINAPTK